jgi:signal transduction histidine kinase
MKAFGRTRSRFARISLSRRLPLSFAGVALFTMIVLGAILLPVLSGHYTRSEASYLQAGAQRAATDLAKVDWSAVAAEKASGSTSGTETSTANQQAKIVALSNQLHIEVFSPDGTLLVDSGSPGDIDPSEVVENQGGKNSDPDSESTSDEDESSGHGLPSPIGSGLFGHQHAGGMPRSDRSMETQLTSNGSVVATLRSSEGPAYGAAVLRSTLIGWLLAGVAAVILAALLGWASSQKLTKPLLAITAASDRMARGDLTVRAEVRRSDEIGSLAGSFNTMAAQMQHTISALQRFVADAAHELGTPLTALEADLELAQAQDDPAGQQRLIGRALQQAERLERLSTNLLRLSRLDTGSLRASLEVTDIVPLIRGMADAIASRADQAGVEFSLDLPQEPVSARIHADGLRTAIDNLVDNALKFTPEGGSVVLGASRTPTGARIWVEDTGIGIPPEDMDGLFGRFHRGRNAAAYPGSGLGLAIVQATMELHGGRVRAESRPEATRFELTLPPV